VLHDLGFIPNDAPLETVRERYAITDAVQTVIDHPDFSRLLRKRLNGAERDDSANVGREDPGAAMSIATEVWTP